MIYLDNHATTAMDPEVATVIHDLLLAGPSNPSSQHAIGQKSRSILDEAIERMGSLFGSDLSQPGGPRLIMTSGGTESNNLALHGLAPVDTPLVISSIEHPSVLAVAKNLQQQGTREVRYLPVDSQGVIQLDQLAPLIEGTSSDAASTTQAGLVSIMSANNETGVIQPIDDVAKICRQLDVPLHVDATQSIGKVPVDFQKWGASAITFTAHKFHGPVGVGALWIDQGVSLHPLFFGGEQQLLSRPGTEPVALVAGMAKALELAIQSQSQTAQHTKQLRNQLENSLHQRHPEIHIHSSQADRLPTTACLSFRGTNRQTMLMALDIAGIACSNGSACSSGSSPPSHVLTAMGCSEPQISSALRFSLSRFSTTEEISSSIDLISSTYNRLRQY